tara:strand:- start:2405 stop:2734 length:330 start_codon:yes stop_codon:yes gene_type:complete
MNKTKFLITILPTLLLLNACGTVAEGLGGTKKKGSDEFLIEKKAPLVLPPSFGDLPEPGKKIEENSELIEENDLSIEEMIFQSSSKGSNIESEESDSSIEKLIIEKINE